MAYSRKRDKMENVKVEIVYQGGEESLHRAMAHTMSMMIMTKLNNMELSDIEKRKIIETIISRIQNQQVE